MKHIVKILIAALLTMPLNGFSQKAFDKFENSDNIGSVTINKGMMGIVASMSADGKNKEAQDFIDLAKSIDNIRVFISENPSASAEMTTTAKSYIKKSSLESLMKVREGDSHVDFYVKSGKDNDHVSELLMMVSGMDEKTKGANIETVLVTMTGDIDLTKVGALVKKMNLPKELEKASKNGK